MKTSLQLIFALFLSFSIVDSFAQISSGGTPFSFSETFQNQFGDQSPESITIPKVNVKKAKKEDEQNPSTRFAIPVSVDFDLNNSGTWTELPNGDGIWRLQLRSKNALALAFLYDQFYLPPGAMLFMYSADKKQVLGAYTFQNNKPSRRFWTGLITGEEAIVEYYEPAAFRGEGRLHLFRVDHAYDQNNLSEGGILSRFMFGFDTALECHVNINCPEGNDWQDEKRGVCRIILVVEEGMGYCTGSLLNNADQDATPYVLGAFHCQDGYTPLWDMYRFDFNYESSDCNNPANEPSFQSILGSTYRAGRQANDFILLELLTPVPASYNAYFNGWDRRTSVIPTNSAMIHHPSGDIRKISVDEDFATIFGANINWDNGTTTPSNHHLRMSWEAGTHELGSSGGPIFNQDGRVVAQLHGGLADCETSVAYAGRFALSWNGGNTPDTRLKDWLDPEGTELDTLNGMENPNMGETGTISGWITTEEDEGISGVTVTLTGGSGPYTMVTGPDGAYSFTDIPFDEAYGLMFEKTDQENNGVSTFDMIKIRKHILGVEDLDTPFKILAADVNASESVSTLDLVRISKVVLAVVENFGDVPPWQFFPMDFQFTDPADPFLDIIPTVYDITNFTSDLTNLNFYGMKSGDVNDSADPD